jgi:hypothetical protein
MKAWGIGVWEYVSTRGEEKKALYDTMPGSGVEAIH